MAGGFCRRDVRFFLLRRYDMDNRTLDLCEWTIKGKELTFNIGASSDPEEFAKAVGTKLEELGR